MPHELEKVGEHVLFQKEAKQELDKEEREAKKKITMDDIHTVFDKSVSIIYSPFGLS